MRKINFLGDTSFKKLTDVPNDITVAQFITILKEAGGDFNINQNILTDKATKTSFLQLESVLPNGDISLFSIVKDPKGNQMTRTEAYQFIKDNNSTGFFSSNGNYTNKPTSVLITMIESFKAMNVPVTQYSAEPVEVLVKAEIIDEDNDVYKVKFNNGESTWIDTDQVIFSNQESQEDAELKELREIQNSFKPSLYK